MEIETNGDRSRRRYRQLNQMTAEADENRSRLTPYWNTELTNISWRGKYINFFKFKYLFKFKSLMFSFRQLYNKC